MGDWRSIRFNIGGIMKIKFTCTVVLAIGMVSGSLEETSKTCTCTLLRFSNFVFMWLLQFHNAFMYCMFVYVMPVLYLLTTGSQSFNLMIYLQFFGVICSIWWVLLSAT